MLKEFMEKMLSRFLVGHKEHFERKEREGFDEALERREEVNFTALFASRLSSLSLFESRAEISAENERAALLSCALRALWSRMPKALILALSTGGCALVPYVKNGKIYCNLVKQSRIYIYSREGERITGVCVLADSVREKGHMYYRFCDYRVKDGKLRIRHLIANEKGEPAYHKKWAGIKNIALLGADEVLFGFLKSPADNRTESDCYGVPLTYGCEKTIADILECYAQIRKEYALKGVRLQVDERTLKKDEMGRPLPLGELFLKGYSEDGDLFHVFDPDIRHSAYGARLESLYALLEKQVGTSRGILTKRENSYTTATEIKASMLDTFSLVSSIRKNVECAIESYIKACDVLAGYYHLSGAGAYEIRYDWSYDMIEESQKTFGQMLSAAEAGILHKAEVRAYLMGESLDVAKKNLPA